MQTPSNNFLRQTNTPAVSFIVRRDWGVDFAQRSFQRQICHRDARLLYTNLPFLSLIAFDCS